MVLPLAHKVSTLSAEREVARIAQSSVPALASLWLGRVQNEYVSSGTRGHARPLRKLKNCSVSSENVSARARKWTVFPYSSFPRNEGVRSSNPRVGSSGFAGVLPGELLKRVSVDNVEQRAVAFEVLGDRPLACAVLVRVATRRVVSAKAGGE